MKIKPSIVRKALSIAGGIYRMNAPYASGYGFCVNEHEKEIGFGEFLSSGEIEERGSSENFDAIFFFKDKTIKNLNTGKVKHLEKAIVGGV